MQIQYELLRATSKQIFESYMWYLRQIKNSWKISPYNNLISYLNSFLENCSNSQCQCTSFQMIWCLSICLSWLVEREELHFRTDWYSTKPETFHVPSLFCFLITIRGGLKWVKAPLTYTTFCVMCGFTWLPTCKIMYHHHNSCKLLTVSNVLLRTQDFSGITRRSQRELPLSFSSEFFLDF